MRLPSRDHKPRPPAPERFGQEFAASVSTAFKECSSTRRLAIILMLALAVFGAATSAGALVVIGLTFAVGLLGTRPIPTGDGLPTDEELAASDAARAVEEIEEYEASGAGHREYEKALARLAGLVHKHVTVLHGGTTDGDWRPVIRLQGTLERGDDVSDDPTYELIQFTVGTSGSSFFLDERLFARGESISRRGSDRDEIMLVLNDGVMLLVFQTTPANA
jgi:hypothetical protein